MILARKFTRLMKPGHAQNNVLRILGKFRNLSDKILISKMPAKCRGLNYTRQVHQSTILYYRSMLYNLISQTMLTMLLT